MNGTVTTVEIDDFGSKILFTSEDNVLIDSIFELQIENRFHYYQVRSIKIGEDNKLIASAKEVNYWASRLNRFPEFDLRTIIGLNVEQVTDETSLKNIRKTTNLGDLI